MSNSLYNIPCLAEYTVMLVGNTNGTVKDTIVITENEDLFAVYDKLKSARYDVEISDDVIFLRAEEMWSIAVYTKKELICKVLDILRGKRYGEVRAWTKGYWLPEGFLIDILKGTVISGSETIPNFLKNEIAQMWSDFSNHLLSQLNQEIYQKEAMINAKDLSPFWATRLSGDIKLAHFRKNNIVSENPLTGFPKNI